MIGRLEYPFTGAIPMRVYVIIYSGRQQQGAVVFHSLVVGENNAECVPADILTSEEVEELRRALCRLPQVNKGKLGRYNWRASNNPQPSISQAGSSPGRMAKAQDLPDSWGR
jgi:hypothetical protein